MRPALVCLLLAALSWPALARQDQSQPPAAQNPPESQAPAQPPAQVPSEPSTPTGTQQAPATEAPPASGKTSKKKSSQRKPAKKKKTTKKHKKAQSKKQPADAPDPSPRRVVVRRGGTSETGGQLEPGLPSADVTRQQQKTEALLQATNANLKYVAGRKLSSQQQDMVRQITSYMDQSRSAGREGDLERAHNLAMKAHLLSDELVRQ
jgi:outer membrane biosynthesis protein TonB